VRQRRSDGDRNSDGTSDQLRAAAAQAFGWTDLRPEQLDAMRPLLAGRDVLAVLPTGAGKSAIYQVPTLLLDGPTVIVSPLLALQRDQIEGLDEADAPDAVAVNSAENASERRRAWQAMRRGRAEYLFLSPEQLAKPDVVGALAALSVTLFVVDEAHCVSAWGHDFRPDYLRLAPVIERLGRPPVLALTATAAPPIRRDIVTALGMREPVVVATGFDRPEIHLSVHRALTDAEKRSAVTARLRDLASEGRGILYVASRKDADAFAAELSELGLRAAAYHAGMRSADRERVQRQFMADEIDVVAATSAFGMGIDKPDIRFVAHASVPDSLDSYYQQIGRAGRDGQPAQAVLFYRPEDLHLQRFLTAHRAPEQVLTAVAGDLRGRPGPVPASTLAHLDVPAAQRTRAVNLLQGCGVVHTSDRGRLRYADPDLPVEEAVDRAARLSEEHQQRTRSRIEMMRGYAETTGCRRQFLLGYFGDEPAGPCGNCDTCQAGTAGEQHAPGGPHANGSAGGGADFAVNAAVRHVEWGPGVVMSTEPDRITVLFDRVGYRTLALDAVRERGLLAEDPDGAQPAQ
jgi:ATP-dependent DNA helicase RecQ